MSNRPEFSHMPEVGVSYGVITEGGTAYLSASFTNLEAGDVFNKKRARQIIEGRISAGINGRNTRFHGRRSDKTALQIVRDMRAMFKPEGEVDQSQFMVTVPYTEDVDVSFPIVRTPEAGDTKGASAWERLISAFDQVA